MTYFDLQNINRFDSSKDSKWALMLYFGLSHFCFPLSGHVPGSYWYMEEEKAYVRVL